MREALVSVDGTGFMFGWFSEVGLADRRRADVSVDVLSCLTILQFCRSPQDPPREAAVRMADRLKVEVAVGA